LKIKDRVSPFPLRGNKKLGPQSTRKKDSRGDLEKADLSKKGPPQKRTRGRLVSNARSWGDLPINVQTIDVGKWPRSKRSKENRKGSGRGTSKNLKKSLEPTVTEKLKLQGGRGRQNVLFGGGCAAFQTLHVGGAQRNPHSEHSSHSKFLWSGGEPGKGPRETGFRWGLRKQRFLSRSKRQSARVP